MVEGEKLSLIAERELMVYDSGREEGYAEGYAESFMAGSDEALDRVIEILDGVISGGGNDSDEPKGHTVTIDGYTFYGGTTCRISTQKPVNMDDGINLRDEFFDKGEGYSYELKNTQTLYAWMESSGDWLVISRNVEVLVSNSGYTYDAPFPLTITEDTHLTIFTE